MGFPDPAGTMVRGIYIGRTFVPAGAGSVTAKLPGTSGPLFALVLGISSWESGGIYGFSVVGASFTLKFSGIAPDPGGGYLDWIAFIGN